MFIIKEREREKEREGGGEKKSGNRRKHNETNKRASTVFQSPSSMTNATAESLFRAPELASPHKTHSKASGRDARNQYARIGFYENGQWLHEKCK